MPILNMSKTLIAIQIARFVRGLENHFSMAGILGLARLSDKRNFLSHG
jgi:hypothetical protein